MDRDIEVTDVSVTVLDRPPESTTDLPTLGPAKVEADQQPVNPTTLELGGSLGINRHWDLLLEVGSDFDDAFLTVFSGSYRF